jgi:1-acyl-sn-glycerol-3-phosphate acyltransferase
MFINVYGGALLLPTRFNIVGLEKMKKKGSYLLLANHQSWLDIMVLERVFLGKIPFAKFFLKSELIWVPVLGLAWWAMDFPFMKRYSKEYLVKRPEKKGKDLEATKKACQKFQNIPLTLVNFTEGTRYSVDKARKQNSPYKHLLKPKAGGVALVLDILGEKLDTIIDVAIVYSDDKYSLWDYLCGRVRSINISVKYIPITEQMISNSHNRESLHALRENINRIWESKDQIMEDFKN